MSLLIILFTWYAQSHNVKEHRSFKIGTLKLWYNNVEMWEWPPCSWMLYPRKAQLFSVFLSLSSKPFITQSCITLIHHKISHIKFLNNYWLLSTFHYSSSFVSKNPPTPFLCLVFYHIHHPTSTKDWQGIPHLFTLTIYVEDVTSKESGQLEVSLTRSSYKHLFALIICPENIFSNKKCPICWIFQRF